jgi:hypothetical protein
MNPTKFFALGFTSPLIRTPFQTLLPLLSLPINARIGDTILDAPITRARLVAALARGGAVCALFRLVRLKGSGEKGAVGRTHGHLDLLAFCTGRNG